MTNADLAAMLNDDLGLTGRSAVTIDVIRQWVAWGMLPKAKAKASTIGTNPQWHRDRSAYRRAIRLALARAAGVHRQTAMIAQAWLEGHYHDHEKAHAALVCEYIRARNRATKSIVTEMAFENFAQVGEVRKRAMRTQLGPLDDRFKGTPFEAPPEFYALAFQVGQIGETDPNRLELLLRQTINAIVPDFPEISAQFKFAPLVASFTGLFGDPTEIANSAERTLRSSSHRQLRIARYWVRNAMKVLEIADGLTKCLALPEHHRSLLLTLVSLCGKIGFGPWPIFLFVQILQSIKSDGTVSLK